MSLEAEIVSWLRQQLPTSPNLRIGLGDDAALLEGFATGSVILSTDTITDQVDFILAETDARQIGHKALGVNLSDLAAMAARPTAALVSLVLPNDSPRSLAKDLYLGMLPLAERHEVVIAGGDTNTWEGPLAISVTVVGEPTEHGVLTRAGAQPGDSLLVTGELGGSILGRHLAVEPRVSAALLLNEQYKLHSGMDISDGLALDASRLAAESGVGIAVELDKIPVSAAARQLSQQDGTTALQHALSDGEDFELLLTAPAEQAERMLGDQPLEVSITRIGEVIAEEGLWQIENGRRTPLKPTGFQHGAAK